MTPKPDRPASLISYAVQRHGQLTTACDIFDRLSVPMRRFSSNEEDIDVPAEDVLRNYQLVLATNIHPEIIQWFGIHARANLAECRFLANNAATKKLTHMEELIQRDVDAINGARSIYDAMDERTQEIIQINGAKRLNSVLALDTPRVLCALSGPVLYAWQDEWYRALVVMKELFEDVDAPEASAMGAIEQRLDDVEDDVKMMRSQMAVAAAVLQQAPIHDQEDDP